MQPGHGVTRQPDKPAPVRHLLPARRRLQAPYPGSMQEMNVIEKHIPRIPKLPADSTIAQERIQAAFHIQPAIVRSRIKHLRSRLEMLDKLAEAQSLPDKAELLLEGFVRGDFGGSGVEAVEVPAVESREVLEHAHELVAADW